MAYFRPAAQADHFGMSFGVRGPRRRGRRLASTIPALERLEDRTLLTNYLVNTLDDVVAADGKVSLREAVQAASTNAFVHEAPSGQGNGVGDSIRFDNALAGKAITLTGGELVVEGDLVIVGPGADRLTIRGAGASRVFNVAAGAFAYFSHLTIAGGSVTAPRARGGGILNAGALQLESCAVVGNAAAGDGGGIASVGPASRLDIVFCTISGNTAGGGGGGVRFELGGEAFVINSTFSGNSAAGAGGGLLVTGSPGTFIPAPALVNVTVFGNRAGTDGTGGSGGGIFAAESAGVRLFNTLVAGNRRGRGTALASSDLSGTLGAASSNNLVGDPASAGGLTHGTNGNLVGADLARLIDPVLRDNGGPTRTHALLPNSAAIDAGDNAKYRSPFVDLPGGDQRGGGFSRFRQARVDIGAFEAAPAADLVGYVNGQWWVGSSTGTNFTTALWAGVPNAAYDALGQADFTGDGKADAFALLDGIWTVGTSTGTAFAFQRWGAWSNADWQDVKTGDLNGDGKADILARLGGQWWAALSNGTTFDAPTLWTAWAVLPWREFFLADVTGDRTADLVGYQRGQWWVGASNGTTFVPPKLVATWADLPWQKLLLPAVHGRADLVGFLSGEWWISRSTGSGTTASAMAPVLANRWANLPFADLNAGNFNGDGDIDVVGRNGGNWFVSLGISSFAGTLEFAAPKLFAQWSNVAWKDVRVADFDGDGRDDITGRFNGQWWVAESTGAGGGIATTTLWATWSELPWQAVGAIDATGPPSGAGSGGGGAFVGGTSPSGSATLLAAATRVVDEPLKLFWLKSSNDEDFATRLLAG